MKIIFFVILFAGMLALPVFVSRMSNQYLVSTGKIKSKKNCTSQTTATITRTTDAGRLNDAGRGYMTKAWYEFSVNGVQYFGFDEISNLPSSNQTVTIFYDPKDPSNNCTKFGKGQDNGSNYVKALLITVGVIAAIIFFLIFVSALLGAGRR